MRCIETVRLGLSLPFLDHNRLPFDKPFIVFVAINSNALRGNFSSKIRHGLDIRLGKNEAKGLCTKTQQQPLRRLVIAASKHQDGCLANCLQRY
jgi:hypothetical protein